MSFYRIIKLLYHHPFREALSRIITVKPRYKDNHQYRIVTKIKIIIKIKIITKIKNNY